MCEDIDQPADDYSGRTFAQELADMYRENAQAADAGGSLPDGSERVAQTSLGRRPGQSSGEGRPRKGSNRVKDR